jgi:hypothetical protein
MKRLACRRVPDVSFPSHVWNDLAACQQQHTIFRACELHLGYMDPSRAGEEQAAVLSQPHSAPVVNDNRRILLSPRSPRVLRLVFFARSRP